MSFKVCSAYLWNCSVLRKFRARLSQHERFSQWQDRVRRLWHLWFECSVAHAAPRFWQSTILEYFGNWLGLEPFWDLHSESRNEHPEAISFWIGLCMKCDRTFFKFLNKKQCPWTMSVCSFGPGSWKRERCELSFECIKPLLFDAPPLRRFERPFFFSAGFSPFCWRNIKKRLKLH